MDVGQSRLASLFDKWTESSSGNSLVGLVKTSPKNEEDCQHIINAGGVVSDVLKCANFFRVNSKFKEANNLYDALLANNEINNISMLDAKEGKALCLMQQGKISEAIELMAVIIEVDNNRWRSLNAIGVAFALAGHIDEAIAYYEAALQASGSHYSVVNNLSITLALTGDLDRATDMLNRAVNSLPDKDHNRKTLSMNLALIYGIKGDFVRSKSILEMYLTYEEVRNNLAYYAMLSKDYKAARSHLEGALRGTTKAPSGT
jgi:Flp pilus assembly protein TadD